MNQDFFAGRRQALLDQMSDNSAAIIFAATEQTRSNDTEYHFRQNSNFFYLSGFGEPDSVILLRKGNQPEYVLFNRDKDKMQEIWHGRRLGQAKAQEILGADQAYSINEMEERLTELLNGVDTLYFSQGETAHGDKVVAQILTALRQGMRKNWRAPVQIIDLRKTLDEMRLIKQPQEIAAMRTAGLISANAHTRAMMMTEPGMFEYQVEAEIMHEFGLNGARFAAYNSIVGGGDNACILHYTENESELQDGDLLLIDAGCEYAGYAADITRTFPVNGRFSPEQKSLYELVLKAQLAAIDHIKPGNSIKEANEKVIRIMIQGLVALGVIAGDVEQLIKDEAYKEFYMHGLGHWIGIDVHDVGDYRSADRSRALEPGMVLTIEPGLYISPDAEVDEKWRGIGIRIEDDLLVTDSGHEVLTKDVVKTVAEIEALMKKQ